MFFVVMTDSNPILGGFHSCIPPSSDALIAVSFSMLPLHFEKKKKLWLALKKKRDDQNPDTLKDRTVVNLQRQG